METKQKVELEMWENIKKDMGYDENDNNEGYIYGLNLIYEDDIIDVQWFKNDEERFKFISENNLEIINE
jgi:hypothetical protein